MLGKRLEPGGIELSQAADVPRALPETLAERSPLAPLAARALAIAAELRHPAYDCFYLALAEARDANLITADRRLIASLKERMAAPLPQPLELRAPSNRPSVVPAAGLEPATSRLQGGCSTVELRRRRTSTYGAGRRRASA